MFHVVAPPDLLWDLYDCLTTEVWGWSPVRTRVAPLAVYLSSCFSSPPWRSYPWLRLGLIQEGCCVEGARLCSHMLSVRFHINKRRSSAHHLHPDRRLKLLFVSWVTHPAGGTPGAPLTHAGSSWGVRATPVGLLLLRVWLRTSALCVSGPAAEPSAGEGNARQRRRWNFGNPHSVSHSNRTMLSPKLRPLLLFLLLLLRLTDSSCCQHVEVWSSQTWQKYVNSVYLP